MRFKQSVGLDGSGKLTRHGWMTRQNATTEKGTAWMELILDKLDRLARGQAATFISLLLMKDGVLHWNSLAGENAKQ